MGVQVGSGDWGLGVVRDWAGAFSGFRVFRSVRGFGFLGIGV